MNRGLSLYLDVLRTLAAFEVFLFHMRRFTPGMERAWWNQWGHEAVVLFFVLSGFVITFAAETRDKTFERYFVSRFTRIFSVAVPAVALTILFDAIGNRLDPDLYAPVLAFDNFWLRLAASLALINESWIAVQVFSNTPYWSIAYEFWYYFLFASWYFFTGWQRWGLTLLFALIAGPRILLLYPIWLLGSWAYREAWSRSLPQLVQWLMFLCVVPVFWAYARFDLEARFAEPLIALLREDGWRTGLHWSRWLLSDLLLGVAVAVHFIGARGLGATLEPLFSRIEQPLRTVAAYSFTLYLLHQPVVLIMNALLGDWRDQPWQPFAVGTGVLLIIWLVGSVTETQRHRLKPFASALYRTAGRPFGVAR